MVLTKRHEQGGGSAGRRPPPHYQGIVKALRAAILSGEIEPASWIRIGEVAAKFHVSAQPVREALQWLQGEGLVVIVPNCGARVRLLDEDRLRDIYQLREAIEATLSRGFAESCGPHDVRALRSIQDAHDQAIECLNLAEIDRANLAFHELIVRRSGNDEALAIRERYLALTSGLREVYGYGSRRWSKIQRNHHALIAACSKGDGISAYVIAAQHVRDTREDMLERMASSSTKR